MSTPQFHGTTILAVRRAGHVVLCGDGQVSLGNSIMKGKAIKVRTLLDGQILTGFAGATADAFTLFEKFEGKLKAFNKNLTRAAVELAKDWRTDRYLRKLEALLLVADAQRTLLISGTGDVVEPDGDAIAIGSGGLYALSAARALLKHTTLDAETIAREALLIASEIDVFTNDQLVVESLRTGGA
ncbi:ATP-dependent protease subunit HslV [Myxococcota bacterium]|nr:ATP-dependent protease subunit HslV [Myxococcota bacterium]MBU1429751.1 ATP-dependent protease subunit HslV [Myxococcota bacterium]MBU1900471.1 ATP-dependent protease subunit HslV [Myxococcota bacterium]